VLDIQHAYTRPSGNWNRLTARIDGEFAGLLAWSPARHEVAPGEIVGLSVVPKYRRRGIATALYDAAMTWPGVNPPRHSAFRTVSGEYWARSVGGYLPRLHNGRYLLQHTHSAAFLGTRMPGSRAGQ
jgi:GNAT superfamily N-acetyltransferase